MRRIAFILALLLGAAPAFAQSEGSVAPGNRAPRSNLTGCTYNSAGVALTDGQQVATQCDAAGNTSVSIGASPGLAGLALESTQVQVVSGITTLVGQAVVAGRVDMIPTVQNAAYASGNDIGGLVSFALPKTGSGILNAISVKFVGGATTSITAYCFDSNPSSSTFTDKSTFTLALADLDKLIFVPQVLTPAVVGTGSAVTFTSATTLARMFNSTATIYCAYNAGGTFTPASTADMHVGIQIEQ